MAKEPLVIKSLNIVTLGESQAGKSTLAGHLSFQLGAFDRRILEKFELESAQLGKSSYKYAWLFDRLARQRERGSSIDVSMFMIPFKSGQSHMLIDTPGRRKVISNTIRGISMADVAVVVVDSQEGHFELSWGKEGVLKDHIVLAYTLGLKQIIVAVNKIQLHSCQEQRFYGIINEMTPFIKKTGFKVEETAFVPISAYNGINLIEKSAEFVWYKGTTLVQAIESVQRIPSRQKDKPFRMPIHKVFKISGIGTVVIGKVTSGTFHAESNIEIAPTNRSGLARSIQINFEAVPQAQAGQLVGINTRQLSRLDVKPGDVCGSPLDGPLYPVSQFEAQIIVMDHPTCIKEGYSPLLHCHTLRVSAKLIKLKSKLDRTSGKVSQQSPEMIKQTDTAIARFKPVKPIYVQPFKKCPSLGRFVLMDHGKIMAVGVVMEVFNNQRQT